MDLQAITHELNDKQQEAVMLPASNVLVLAGAGSGKTRVLVHRLAWLFSHDNISPLHILAVTFTNKAANEMKTRIEQLLGISTAGMWVGTFHGLCHRLLRIHHERVNLAATFQVIDSDDQYRLLKRIIKEHNLDEKNWNAKSIQWFINAQKDEGKTPDKVSDDVDVRQRTLIKLYAAYEKVCHQNGLVDFSGLLLLAYRLLSQNTDILNQYQTRFAHLLVDEFQDTNKIQYDLLKLLKSDHNYLMAVGDDDQSIYGWRGARVENILRFEQDLPKVNVIRLEQNYRSTQTILRAANALIGHNTGRMGKSLWSDGKKGDPIINYQAFNELEEAEFIVARIQQLREEYAYDEFAVLYRSNAQSRVLEEALLQQRIPYRVYGGMRFFERAEIKTALAYLRLIVNPQDDHAFLRVVNTPTRGIGDRTVGFVRECANSHQFSLVEAAKQLIATDQLAPRAANALKSFIDLLDSLSEACSDLPLYKQVDLAIQRSGLIAHYQKEPSEKATSRIENLGELVSAARQFHLHDEDLAGMSPLSAFLSHASLEAGEGQANRFEKCVQLMTLHSAKGLEFPVVFISGLEDHLFPSPYAVNDALKLEEERRLCYVGMTRAKHRLFLTHCESRRIHGTVKHQYPSRFLKEVPKQYLHFLGMRSSIQRPKMAGRGPDVRLNSQNTSPPKWKIGQRVTHPSFGEGTVINTEGDGDNMRLHIQFSMGSKWIMPAFAKLSVL